MRQNWRPHSVRRPRRTRTTTRQTAVMPKVFNTHRVDVRSSLLQSTEGVNLCGSIKLLRGCRATPLCGKLPQQDAGHSVSPSFTGACCAAADDIVAMASKTSNVG